MNEVTAQILGGLYDGKPIKVEFGKPLKIYCDGRDISDTVNRLMIEVSPKGQFVHITFVEVSPKMVR